MNVPQDLQKRLIEKFGRVVDLKENSRVISDIFDEARQVLQAADTRGASPFGVSWMDSWVAHWIYEENLKAASTKNRELAAVLQSLVDIKFNERLTELQRFVREQLHRVDEPPDGGPPEPGTPPAGPSRFTAPDGGPPEPGSPPAGPVAFEPPDGGTPEPGVPPTGPDAGFLRENPWILYWFISIKAPALLDVIDAHFNKRLDDLSLKSAGR